MAHVLVYYPLLVVIIICIMFVKLRKCWRVRVHQRIALYKSYYYYYYYYILPLDVPRIYSHAM